MISAGLNLLIYIYTKHANDTLNGRVYTAMYPVCDSHGDEMLVISHRTDLAPEKWTLH